MNVRPSTPQRVESGPSPALPISPALVTLTAPLSVGAEAIRGLRTHIVAQHIEQGRRALAICGPSASVGCTFTAANLAVALAQVGLKTLLVDADLRTPSVQNIIASPGESEGLRGCLKLAGSRVDDFINHEVLPNLAVFYGGGDMSNPQELLARDWFEEVMNECMREFDATIVDTPPANTSADARRISHVVGYSLVVAKRNKTLVADVKTLVDQLTDDSVVVVGTLLNAD